MKASTVAQTLTVSYKFTRNFKSNTYLPISVCELSREGNREEKKKESERGKGDTSEAIKSRKSLLNARQVILTMTTKLQNPFRKCPTRHGCLSLWLTAKRRTRGGRGSCVTDNVLLSKWKCINKLHGSASSTPWREVEGAEAVGGEQRVSPWGL